MYYNYNYRTIAQTKLFFHQIQEEDCLFEIVPLEHFMQPLSGIFSFNCSTDTTVATRTVPSTLYYETHLYCNCYAKPA